MNVFSFLNEQAVIMIVQLLIGKYLKGNERFENTFIPIVTWLVAVLGLNIAPASAHAMSLGFLGPALNIGLLSLVQTVFTTGVHGISKNTILPILGKAARAAAFAILKEKK